MSHLGVVDLRRSLLYSTQPVLVKKHLPANAKTPVSLESSTGPCFDISVLGNIGVGRITNNIP